MKHFITGGAGFIGANLASRLLAAGEQVTVFDNLSRPLTQLNLDWLRETYSDVTFVKGDIRDSDSLAASMAGQDIVYHLAAQVAVTTSVSDPVHDFAVNAGGTLNVLEAARGQETPPLVFYSSTNKVYGEMLNARVVESDTRYALADLPEGVPEHAQLDFHSPYGCSKGAAEQYVRDYARIYNLETIVFRQSCIYGPRQFGVEDQGWAAHFAISGIAGKDLRIYGNGKQVRDMLHVDDLVTAITTAIEKRKTTTGRIYNIGGGQGNSISIWREFQPLLEELIGRPIGYEYLDWRPGDQQIYVSDTALAQRDFGWRPDISLQEGIESLVRWVRDMGLAPGTI